MVPSHQHRLLPNIQLVLHSVRNRLAFSERLHAVDPRILAFGRRSKRRRSGESADSCRSDLRAAGVGHVDILAVIRGEHYAHVDKADAVAYQEPVAAAREHRALEPRPVKLAAGNVHDHAHSFRRVRNDYWRRNFGGDFKERFQFHLEYLLVVSVSITEPGNRLVPADRLMAQSPRFRKWRHTYSCRRPTPFCPC